LKFNGPFFFLRYAFATFDANNDGSIDFDEFLLAIAATSQGDLDDRLEVAFEM
jgi:neurocalcin delta